MSIIRLESGIFTDDQEVAKETEKPQSFGVAMLILGLDSNSSNSELLIWTIIEKQDKPATDKKRGQLSTPAETRKIGESPQSTVIAALAEFTDNDEDIDHLYFAGYIPGAVSIRDNPADVVIMIYDGSLSDTHLPVDPDETQSKGWVTPNYLRKINGELRPVIHDVLQVVSDDDMTFLVTAHTDPSRRTPLRGIVGADFSIRGFTEARDLISDKLLS